MARRILYLEPFDGGSHAAFTRTLIGGVDAIWTVLTLPGRHWKWRMRGAAPYWARAERATLEAGYDLVFASAYVPLAELFGLAPALAGTPSILYFHENQLTYPVREDRERDHHYGFTQLVSALAATRCVFNSAYNQSSLLEAGAALLARMPDRAPPGWIEAIEGKSAVLPVPLDLPDLPASHFEETPSAARAAGPVILWNHRWEHDKAPEVFFEALLELAERNVPFRLIVCGQRYADAPSIFERARAALDTRLLHFGPVHDRADYEALLGRAHLVVSTARHEFFGVSVVEAVHFGARPLVPDRLSYPELWPAEHRYRDGELVERLEGLIGAWTRGATSLRADRRALTARFGEPALDAYRRLLEDVAEGG